MCSCCCPASTRWWGTWKEGLFIPHGIPVLSACLMMCMPWSSSLSFVVSVAQLSGIVPGRVMLADAEVCMASTRTALGGCSFLFPFGFHPAAAVSSPAARLWAALVSLVKHAQCSTNLCEVVVPNQAFNATPHKSHARNSRRQALCHVISIVCTRHGARRRLQTHWPFAHTTKRSSHRHLHRMSPFTSQGRLAFRASPYELPTVKSHIQGGPPPLAYPSRPHREETLL